MGPAKRQAVAGTGAGEPGSAYRSRRSVRSALPAPWCLRGGQRLASSPFIGEVGSVRPGYGGSRAAGGRPRPHLGTRGARTGSRPRSPSGGLAFGIVAPSGFRPRRAPHPGSKGGGHAPGGRTLRRLGPGPEKRSTPSVRKPGSPWPGIAPRVWGVRVTTTSSEPGKHVSTPTPPQRRRQSPSSRPTWPGTATPSPEPCSAAAANRSKGSGYGSRPLWNGP